MENADYRRMYYNLAGAVETAIRILIEAQQKCEDILLEEDDMKLHLLSEKKE